MSTRLVHVVIDANDHRGLASWWSAALGAPVAGEADDEAWITLDGGLHVVFVPVGEAKSVKNRVHLDLSSGGPYDQARFVEELISRGAAHADIGQDDTPWVVLADPEGNEFCVLEARDMFPQHRTLAAVVIDAVDPPGLAAFWSEATSWPVFDVQPWGTTLRAPSGTGPTVDFITFGDPKVVKDRLHLDVAPMPDGDTQAEAEHLVALGARRIDVGQGDVPWVVLADPEGNEFCVLTPR